VIFTPGTTTANTTYSATTNTWTTALPSNLGGSDFLGGVALAAPSGLPGSIKNVTWQGQMQSDTANVQVQWKWEAAVYSKFSTDYTTLGVKPCDDGHASSYQNGDHGGAPEAFKASVIAGATGNGGNNYTGNASPNAQLTPPVPPPPGVTYVSGNSSDYPFASSNPLTSISFNESDVLTGAALNTNNSTFEIWYTDEHALTLGVNQQTVIAANGTSTTTNSPVTPMSGNPSSAANPALGVPGAADPSGRPLTPELYITDITTNTTSRSGDWQYGGAAYAPSAVFGTWKSATETINNALGGTVTVSVASDPTANGTNLGAGADKPPAGLPSAGYTSEVRWDLNALAAKGILLPGHNYRFYVMVHDGDQNKTGGDVGQASYQVNNPIPAVDLAITKTDNSPTYSLGERLTYVITVTNNGPANAIGATVADVVPAMLSGVSWTSYTTGNASVTSGASGSGNNLAATVNIAAGPGNSVTFLVSGTTPSDWCTVSGNLVNTATVTPAPGVIDSNLSNNSATDIDTLSVGQSPITVNSGADDPSGPSPGVVTFRDAVNAVDQGTADAILFAIPGTPTINLTADVPALTRRVYIDGTTEAGVTVNGNGYAMLVVGSTVNLKNVSFNQGTITVAANDALNVESDFNVGVSTLVQNYGSVDVCGSFLGGNHTEVYNHDGALFNADKHFIGGDFSFMYDFGTAAVTVGGNYTLGAYGFVYNYNTSSLRVTDNFTLGNNGYVYNGTLGTDAATFSAGGNFQIGDSNAGVYDSGYVYNYGTSKFTVGGNFAISDPNSYVYNGVFTTDVATFTVGGSLSLAAAGSVYNYGTSTMNVTGDLTLGNDGYLYSGATETDAALLTVGGNFRIGDASAGPNDRGYVYGYGRSVFHVAGDFIIYGGGGSFLWNGVSSADSSVVTVGGNFSLGPNSFVYNFGTSNLSVAKNFTLGATSTFRDDGTISVGGSFDPGSGDPNNPIIVSGAFTLASGSSVTTNTATWEVLAGGHLDVAAGATFTVAAGGTVLDYGSITVEGLFASVLNSLIVIETGGSLTTNGAGQLNIQGTLQS
jgi:uncharacterized repeat protein (TIGR01451 family)